VTKHSRLLVSCLLFGVAMSGAVYFSIRNIANRRDGDRHGHITHLFVGIDDALPRYDAYMTWNNYDPFLDPTAPYEGPAPTYILNGRALGQGTGGFDKLVAELGKMPRGSVILMYPAYDYPRPEDSSSRPADYPFMNYSTNFWTLLADRGFTLVHSVKDHRGRIHPFFERRISLRNGDVACFQMPVYSSIYHLGYLVG